MSYNSFYCVYNIKKVFKKFIIVKIQNNLINLESSSTFLIISCISYKVEILSLFTKKLITMRNTITKGIEII